MQRRALLLLTAQWRSSLDLWHMQVEQMKRDDMQRELDRKNEAAMHIREIRASIIALRKSLDATEAAVSDPHITDATKHKQYLKALRLHKDVVSRAINSLKD